jgi:hypothetical protein
MSDPEDELNQQRISDFIGRLLRDGFTHFTPPPIEEVKQYVEHVLTELALAGGVPPHLVMEHLDLAFVDEGGAILRGIPRNMFTTLLTLGIVRDPEVLQALTVRTEGEGGAWTDRFTDERGTTQLAFTPPEQYDILLMPLEPIRYIKSTFSLDLPEDPS